MTSNSKSLWERTVELSVRVGERVLAPIERWIGRRSLVGDATFFPLERFPWVAQVEQNWTVIRDEVVGLLVDVLRPLPEPESAINRAIVKAISYSPFVLDAKRNQQAWERRFQERPRERALAGAGVKRAA